MCNCKKILDKKILTKLFRSSICELINKMIGRNLLLKYCRFDDLIFSMLPNSSSNPTPVKIFHTGLRFKFGFLCKVPVHGSRFTTGKKDTAKRTRQHAGKKVEYVQRRVCFVNAQVPWPHSNINAKFCTSRLCMKIRLFCLFAHGQCRVYYIYHVEFHFRFEHLITFPV